MEIRSAIMRPSLATAVAGHREVCAELIDFVLPRVEFSPRFDPLIVADSRNEFLNKVVFLTTS